MRTKKHLGQNFLKNVSIARELIDAARVSTKDTIVEVGPGRGMITRILLEKAGCVIAVEKDEELVEFLKKEFAEDVQREKLVIVCDDILVFNPGSHKLKAGSYKLIGSIPYYITGQFLRKFLSIDLQPHTVALIIQKEVALRLCSGQSGCDKKESLLSLSVKAYGAPRYVKTVKAGSFQPKPKVDSAILVIENISKKFFADVCGTSDVSQLEKKLFELLKIGFGSKRKKLATNLTDAHKKNPRIYPRINPRIFLKECGISPDARAEDLSLAEWKKLYLKMTAREI